jgi:post-segregation antitoxin (ccd killing protein)
MKVSKTVSIDLELLRTVLSKEKNFSAAVTEALEMWLAKKLENEKWTIKEKEKASLNKKET